MRLLISILICLVPSFASAMDIHVAAAASLREFMTEAVGRFEERYPEHHVLVNTASSGTLARQIAAGAPADIFLSANPEWVNYLVDVGKVAAGRVLSWAGNQLVSVGRGQELDNLKDLASYNFV